MSGAGFWVESGSPHEKRDGWLRVQTLVPTEDDSDRIKIGGRGHEFEVAGIQYGVTDEGYSMTDDPYAVQSTIGLEGWRVEIRAKKPSQIVEFLHVLQVGTGNRKAANEAQLSSDSSTHTVTIEQADKTFILKSAKAPSGSTVGVREGAVARPKVRGCPATSPDHASEARTSCLI